VSPPPRRVLHLDVDAFLASVEQALHPELAGRPVIVGGMPDGRNLVMSCSYEARAFGVRSGMLSSEAARRCPRAIFRHGDSQAANRMREGIAHLLLRCTPHVEVASLDDFFADLTGTERLLGTALEVAEHVRAAIRDELHLPVTIGVASNKTMARIAGKLAKPGGVCELWPGYERSLLASLPVEHLPGVGRSIGRELERFAIRTVGELALVSREILFASFGAPGLVVHERARGIDDAPVQPTFTWEPAAGNDTAGDDAADDMGGAWVERPPRTIRRDSTFEPEEGRRAIVEAMLGYLVERAAYRLRLHHAGCRSLAVRVVYVDTRPRDAGRGRGVDEGRTAETRHTLPAPGTDSTDELWQHACTLLRAFPRRRALVKRVGVTLFNLGPLGGWQKRLFSDPGRDRGTGASVRGATGSRADRQRRLDRALDELRRRHGFGRILSGTSYTLKEDYPLGEDGFRLRTPSLNQ